MTRAVLIHTPDGPGAIAVGERNVREPRIGEAPRKQLQSSSAR